MDTTHCLTAELEADLIEDLYKQIVASGKIYKAIAIEGRGGLSIAQKLAYKLDIEKVKFITKNTKSKTLFVDDISCTGKTLSGLNCDTATLVYRSTSKVKPTFFALEVKSANYIKFSWEK